MRKKNHENSSLCNIPDSRLDSVPSQIGEVSHIYFYFQKTVLLLNKLEHIDTRVNTRIAEI